MEFDIEPILEAGKAVASREIQEITAPGGQKMALLPGATDLIELPLRKPQPESIKASPVFQDSESFVEYVNLFKSKASMVFVQEKNVDANGNLQGDYRMTARLDYHAPGAPAYLEHAATLEFAPSIEWVRWLGIAGKPLNQHVFAEFIEENIRDVQVPDPLVLLEAAQNFEEKRNVRVVSKRRLDNGIQELTYQEEVAGGGTETSMQKIPTKLVLRLRPFAGFGAVEVPARLRYAVSKEGNVAFTVVLDRLSEVLEPFFNAISLEIKGAVNLPLLVGRS